MRRRTTHSTDFPNRSFSLGALSIFPSGLLVGDQAIVKGPIRRVGQLWMASVNHDLALPAHAGEAQMPQLVHDRRRRTAVIVNRPTDAQGVTGARLFH